MVSQCAGRTGKFTPKSRPWRSLTRRAWSGDALCPGLSHFAAGNDDQRHPRPESFGGNVWWRGSSVIRLANGRWETPSSPGCGAWAFVVAPHLLSWPCWDWAMAAMWKAWLPSLGWLLQVRHFHHGLHLAIDLVYTRYPGAFSSIMGPNTRPFMPMSARKIRMWTKRPDEQAASPVRRTTFCFCNLSFPLSCRPLLVPGALRSGRRKAVAKPCPDHYVQAFCLLSPSAPWPMS